MEKIKINKKVILFLLFIVLFGGILSCSSIFYLYNLNKNDNINVNKNIKNLYSPSAGYTSSKTQADSLDSYLNTSNRYLITKEFVVDNLTINSNGNSRGDIDITKSGYKPIIVNYAITTGTNYNSSTQSSPIYGYALRLFKAQNTLYYNLGNAGSKQTCLKLTVWVTYVKER